MQPILPTRIKLPTSTAYKKDKVIPNTENKAIKQSKIKNPNFVMLFLLASIALIFESVFPKKAS